MSNEHSKSFQDLINADKPVLVDFYADWCGPCHAMTPVVKEVAEEMNNKAHVVKVDIDRNQAVAGQLGITSIPTFIIFKSGKIVWRHTGGTTKTILKQALEANA